MSRPPIPSASPASPQVERCERLWLLAAIVVGVWLRWGCLGRLAVEHYDEAVYASNLMFGPEGGYEYPGRQYHAPALLPAQIEWLTIAWRMIGLTDVSWLPMLTGLICGTLLIPSVWWGARQWFSPVAGVAAAWLVALSEYHAFYSRSALTDPEVVLWMLWAVHFSWQSLGADRVRLAVAAGVFTALAWWTKYSGWLPLAITFAGGLCAMVMSTERSTNGRRWLKTMVVQSLVAAGLWSPVLWDCQIVGGYGAVAANHRSYLRGWSSWGSDWLQQNANVHWYAGAGLALAMLAILIASSLNLGLKSPTVRQRRAWMASILLLNLWLSYAGYSFAADLLVGICAIGSALRAWQTHSLTETELRAGCLLSAWFAGLFLTTPLYHPYPRLCLPIWLAGAMGIAWWVHRQLGPAVSFTAADPRDQKWHMAWIGGVTATALSCLTILGSPAWEPRTSARVAAKQLVQQLSQPDQSLAYVFADPGMFFELNRAGLLASPRGDFRIERVPQAAETLLVLGLYVDRIGNFPAEWAMEADRYERVAELDAEPSSIVLLDNDTPWDLRAKPKLRRRVWRVYRVKP
ncbi:hypothetical protein GC163_11065 [bacterium]|nr:hypothetical protein [bacterium]